jgi:hypothetical protein
MDLRFSSPRSRGDWISYKRESRRAEGLDDPARVAEMQEMYQLYLVFQRAKSAEQLEAEARAERRLNAWRLNRRFRSLLEESHGVEDAD